MKSLFLELLLLPPCWLTAGDSVRTHRFAATTPAEARLWQRPEKIVPIDIVYEDGFAPNSPADHMVNRSRILHSRFALHGPNLPPFPSLSQPSNAQCYGLTLLRL